MFNLEQSIADWRKQMLAGGIKTPVPLTELESHLRDDVEQQLRKGIGAQAAFDAAAKQLGRADMLRQEFKQDRLDIRLSSPIYLHVYCFLAAPLMISMVWASPETGANSVSQLVSVTAALLIALYVGCLPLFYLRLFAGQSRLMHAVLPIGYWFMLTWTPFALLSVLIPIHIGNAVGMVGWSVYSATFATLLAGANYEREQVKEHAARLMA